MPTSDNAIGMFKAFPTDKGDGSTCRDSDWAFAIEFNEAGDTTTATYDLAIFDDEVTAKAGTRMGPDSM